ncbi:MAG: hypothetical protein AB7I33_13825 [Gemmatimonadales bacterium]
MTATTSTDQRSQDTTWTLLGLAGLLFLVIGTLEIGTVLFPLTLGSPEWEFGTYSSLMDTLPLFLLGLGLLASYAVTRQQRGLAVACAVVFFAMTLLIFAGAFLYATNLPQVLRVPAGSPLQTSLKKAVTKTAIQTAFFPMGFLWFGIAALRYSRRSR